MWLPRSRLVPGPPVARDPRGTPGATPQRRTHQEPNPDHEPHHRRDEDAALLEQGILDQLAKFERAKTAERSRRGKNRMVAEGKVVKGPRPPYGFIYDAYGNGLVAEPAQMDVVRRIFEMMAVKGFTLGEIARRLTGEGVPSPMASNTNLPVSGNWQVPTIGSLVKNPLYRPLTVEEIAASALVKPEVIRSLDPEEVFGLWTWNKRYQKMWRERDEDGVHRDRYQMVPRPKYEWLAVPIPLSEAGLSRAHVDAAREKVGDNQRRPPSTAAQRFWQRQRRHRAVRRVRQRALAIAP